MARLFGLAAAQGSGGAQEALNGLDSRRCYLVAVAQRAKKQADADAMMEQLLAEDVEEKAKDAAKSAKGAKGKKARKKRGKPPAASTNVGTDHALETGDAGVEAGVEDSGEFQAVLMPVAPSPDSDPVANPAAPEPITPFVEARAAVPVPVPVAIGRASGWGRGGRGLGGRGGQRRSPPPPLPPPAVTSLADAQFDTGRPEPPESTIGGQSTCIVCFTNPKSHVAVPCGHQCACSHCSAQMQECPVCRRLVQTWVHVHVA